MSAPTNAVAAGLAAAGLAAAAAAGDCDVPVASAAWLVSSNAFCSTTQPWRLSPTSRQLAKSESHTTNAGTCRAAT